MFPRLQWTLQQLNEQGIGISHILWQQGESEAAKRSPDADAWVRDFMAMVDAIRTIGVNAPIYVAQCTICRNDPNEIIRQAQRRVVNPAQNILPGPDIDLIARDQRYDDCHLSAAGLRRAAELWCEALSSLSCYGICEAIADRNSSPSQESVGCERLSATPSDAIRAEARSHVASTSSLWRNAVVAAQIAQLHSSEVQTTLSLGVLYVYSSFIEGDVVEFGTMSGTTATAIARVMVVAERSRQRKALHLFDSFVGLPEATSAVDKIASRFGQASGCRELVAS